MNDLLKEKQVERIVITGHSMGAALATINGLYLSLTDIKIPIEVHQFGSPRLGNNNLGQFIRVQVPQHYRVVHNRDIVPHLPP